MWWKIGLLTVVWFLAGVTGGLVGRALWDWGFRPF